MFFYLIVKFKYLYFIFLENFELFYIFEIEKIMFFVIKKFLNVCFKLFEYKERWLIFYDEKLFIVLSNKSVRFVGYFFLWKYWFDYEDEIWKFLMFKDFIV